MKRTKSAFSLWTLRYAFAWTVGAPVVLIPFFVAPPAARAQDEPLSDDLAVIHALLNRGVYSETIDGMLEAWMGTKAADACALKAWNLAGRAKAENNPSFASQAKSFLAKATGSRYVKLAEAAVGGSLPAPKFGSMGSKYELDLAWWLKNRGRIGLAEATLDGAMKSGSLKDSDMREAKMTLALCYGQRASTPELGDSDAAKRKDFFEKAKNTALEVASASGAPDDDVVEAKCTLYDLYYKRGQGLLDAAKRNADQEEALKKESLEAFKDAVAFLTDETKKLDDEMSKGEPAAPADPGAEKKEGDQPAQPKVSKAERCHKFAKYYLPKCMVGQARCIVAKDEHDKIVKAAIDVYNDYNLQYGQDFQGFEAAIDMSDAYLEIHDEENAIVALESALAIEKLSPDYDPLHPPDPRKGLTLDEGSLDVFARASLAKGKLLKSKRDWKKALAVFDKVFADAVQSKIKDYDSNPFAQSIKIERAEALARDGKQKEAVKDLQKMADADPTGPVGQKARAMLARVQGGGGGGGGQGDEEGLTWERALTLMQDAYDKNEPMTAMPYARAAMRIAKREGAESKANPKALLGLGMCFELMHRYYEASVCFDEVVHRYKESEQAGNAALESVKCFQTLKSVVPNNYDKNAYDTALQFLTTSFPNVGKGVAPFLLGNSLKEEGKFDEAVKAYDQVTPEAAKLYDEALYLGGLCRYLLAKTAQKDKKDPKPFFADTESSLKKAIEIYGKDDAGINEERKTTRKNLDAEARFLLADVLLQDAINKPTDVLPLFETADKAYEGNADRLSRAGLNRILAYLKLKQLDKAEEQLKVLLEKYKGTKRTILAAKDVGQALHREQGENKNLSADDKKKMRARICDYYARWIIDGLASQDARPSVKDMLDVAKALWQFGCDLAGLPEEGGFIGEVEDNFDPGAGKQPLADAHEILVELAKPDVASSLGKSKSTVFALLGETAGFAKDWANCKVGIDGLIADMKLLDEKGQLNTKVLQARQELLAYYFDLGKCYQMLGEQDKANYAKALEVFNNVVSVAVEGKKTWWKAKYEYYKTQDKRGSEDDYKELPGELRALGRKYPDFKEAEKSGMADKFRDLVKALEAKGKKVN